MCRSETLTFKEIIQKLLHAIQKKIFFPAFMLAKNLQNIPIITKSLLTEDQLKLLKYDNITRVF